MGLLDRIKNLFSEDDSSTASASDTPENVAEVSAGGAGFDSRELLEQFKQKICELSTGQLEADAIDPSASLFDFGYLDSLSAVTMISFIDTDYGVSVSEIDLVEELDNLQALVDRVARDRTR